MTSSEGGVGEAGFDRRPMEKPAPKAKRIAAATESSFTLFFIMLFHTFVFAIVDPVFSHLVSSLEMSL